MGRSCLRAAFTTIAISGVIVSSTLPALAQGAPPSSPPPTAQAGKSVGNPLERARVHYERGLQLFNEENYDAALFEFERAYELAPSYKILYNMGRIQRQQNNYAAAMRSYTRYLLEAGGNVPAERRAEVEAEMAVLRPRVASVKVTVNLDGATVYADDIPVCTATIESSCVGKSPLQAPIIVNGGRHKITATKPGYAPATSLVSVVGSDHIDVKLDLVAYAQAAAPPRRVPWGGWVATGVLAAGAGVLGYLSLSQSAKLEDERGQLNVDADKLDSRASRTKTFGLIGDGLAVTAVVVGAISLYYTIKWGKETNEARPTSTPAAAVPPSRTVGFSASLNGGGFTF